mgnify:CR=1 FL=1|jgi:hypothetical protein
MKSNRLRLSYIVDWSKATFSRMEDARSDAPPVDATSAFTQFMNYGPMCKASLMGLVPVPRHIQVRNILREVASAHSLTVKVITTKGPRTTHIVRGKQEAISRLLLETSLSSTQIGRTMGYADHSTVLHTGTLLYNNRIQFKTGAYRLTAIPDDVRENIPRKGRRGGADNTTIRGLERELEREAIAAAQSCRKRVASPGGRLKGL